MRYCEDEKEPYFRFDNSRQFKFFNKASESFLKEVEKIIAKF